MPTTLPNITLLAIGAALFAIAWAIITIIRVLKKPAGDSRMREIASFIQEGANAYLYRQYLVIGAFAVAIFFLLAFAPGMGWNLAIGFAGGAILSGAAGYIGMSVSVRANVRTTEAAKKGLSAALDVAFKGGSVTGFFVVGLALGGVATLYLYLTKVVGLAIYPATEALVGFGFGASLISLFARVGGGIFTKAADVGADLVGKVEAGIPEDDPRNPATIADNVGDNVGDCAGMGADLFETYAVTMIAAMVLAAISLGGENALTENHVLLPLAVGAASIVATFFGTFFVRLGKKNNIMRALYQGTFVTALLAAIAFYYINENLTGDTNIFYAGLVGYVITILLVAITEYYTSTRYAPVRSIAKASTTGAGTNIIEGLAIGLKSTFWPTLTIVGGIVVAYHFAGLYGIAIAAVAMLSTTGMVIAMDSYGPITDNAGGIAEMSKQPEKVRKITDALDAVGNTTKAVTKGYAIGSAALGALVLFQAYGDTLLANNPSGNFDFSLNNPPVLVGLLLGALLPFIFSAYCMQAVGRAGFSVVEEVRRQFREIKGIMEGKAKPDYARCVDIVTKAALRQMIVPALIAVTAPIIVGYLFGPIALAGLLIGVIASGLLVALMMSNGGGAWDNAKKYIEDGKFGGKGSDAHKAAVVGDTVGDPYKDTAGPAINALIKVINTIALILAAILANWGGLIHM
ncbi:MAG: sodium-translocating pyrophosphatase [Patescibacteria group bacterium]